LSLRVLLAQFRKALAGFHGIRVNRRFAGRDILSIGIDVRLIGLDVLLVRSDILLTGPV